MVAPYDEKVKRKKIATAFVLSNGSSLALFVDGIRVAKALMEK